MSVVSLRGGPVGNPHEPDQDVISILEETLEAARSGYIAGIVLGVNYADGGSAYGYGGHIIDHGMIGALDVAKATVISMRRDTE